MEWLGARQTRLALIQTLTETGKDSFETRTKRSLVRLPPGYQRRQPSARWPAHEDNLRNQGREMSGVQEAIAQPIAFAVRQQQASNVQHYLQGRMAADETRRAFNCHVTNGWLCCVKA